MPLFLSEQYKSMFDKSSQAMIDHEAALRTTTITTNDDKKKAKGSAKMYKSQYLLEKLNI